MKFEADQIMSDRVMISLLYDHQGAGAHFPNLWWCAEGPILITCLKFEADRTMWDRVMTS